MKFRPTSLLFSISLLATSCAFGGESSVAEWNSSSIRWKLSDSISGWSFAVNQSWHRVGRLSFHGASRSGGFTIPDLFSPDTTIDPMIGTLDALGDREYDDGFVRRSGFTEATGLTSNWGYDNQSQVGATTLDFHSTGSRTQINRGFGSATGFHDSESLNRFSPQFDFEFIPRNKPFKFSSILVSLTFSGANQTFGFSDFSNTQSQATYRRDFTDTFLQGGLIGNVPDPGHVGSYSGPGPLIPNQPDQRVMSETLVSTNDATISNSVLSAADFNTISLSVGPTFQGRINNKFLWKAATGTTLTFYNWKTFQTETLNATLSGSTQNLSSWQDRNSGNHFGMSLFGRIGVIYELDDDWFLQGFMQGELGKAFTISAGPSAFRLNPSGFSLGLGIGRSF